MKIHCKLIALSLFCVLNALNGHAQSYQTVEEVNDACAQLGFSGNEDAEIAVDNILDQIGVPRNFTLQECPEINNAIAKNIQNSAGLLERYILYDSQFFSRMDEKAGNDWAAVSILAHEIGHHLSGHALNNLGSSHKFEIEADYFSGNALARLGATLEEAQSAIMTLRYEKATATHPAKADRLAAIERGWNKAKGVTNVKTEEEKVEETAIEYFRKGEQAFTALDYENAIDNFDSAKDLGSKDAYFYLALSYWAGTGVKSDRVKAFELAKKGYELGSVPSTFIMARFLAEGVGTKVNVAESDRLFKKSYQIKWFKDQYKKYKQPIYAYAIATMYYNGYGGVDKDEEIAVIWFRQAAEKNEPRSLNYLGYMYEKGEFFKKDPSRAMDYYKAAANTGYASAEYNIGVHYENGSIVDKDEEQALYWYKRAADKNLALALVTLGNAYHNGNGVSKDHYKARKLYEEAAAQLYGAGFYQLGWLYRFGYGVDQDYLKAADYFQKAIDHSYYYAGYWLGRMYYFGLGVEKDYKVAYEKLLIAAEKDNSYQAQNHIGEIFYYGHGVNKSYKEAVNWYQKAAEQGYSLGQDNMGHMYTNGYGVPKDYKLAVHYYRLAAEQGHANAQNNLGDKYEYGDGIAKDYDQAFYWYKKSAENGNQRGCYNLGKMYLNGRGVAKDRDKAVYWYKEAAKKGHQKAKNKLRELGETWD